MTVHAKQFEASVGDTVAYVRVSTEDQATDLKTSLADQRRAIAQLAAHLGRHVDRVFEDPGASGGSAERRPAFMQLVAFCESHPRPTRGSLETRGYVLVLNDSRWGRFPNPEEAAYWRIRLEKCGWLVRFAEGDEAQDVTVRTVMRALHGTQATIYRETLRANTRRGMRGTVAQGYWAREAPIGYRRRVIAGGPERTLEPGQRKADNEKVRLVPAPAAEVALITHCFKQYAMGTTSLAALVRWLRARDRDRRWSTQHLAKVLTNPVYIGHVVAGRRGQNRDSQLRPREEWIVTERAHAPLVSQDLFDEVQARLKLNHRSLRRTAGGYALSGLLTCTCGRPYIGGGGPKGPATDPDRYRFYRCAGQKDVASPCAAPSGTLARRLIEPAVVQLVSEITAAAALQPEALEELDALLASTRGEQPDRRALERRREQLGAEHQRLVDAIAAGVLDAFEAKPTLERIRCEKADVGAALEQARFGDRQARVSFDERDRLMAMARDFATHARRLHGLQLRELLRPWIESAVVDLGAREVRLAVRRIPQATTVLLSSPQGAPEGQQQKLIVRRTIALPPRQSKRRAS